MVRDVERLGAAVDREVAAGHAGKLRARPRRMGHRRAARDGQPSRFRKHPFSTTDIPEARIRS